MTHYNGSNQKINQVWVTEEAKKAALLAAHKRGMNLQEFISRAILAYAKEKQGENDG